jgi:hypothetical protein
MNKNTNTKTKTKEQEELNNGILTFYEKFEMVRLEMAWFEFGEFKILGLTEIGNRFHTLALLNEYLEPRREMFIYLERTHNCEAFQQHSSCRTLEPIFPGMFLCVKRGLSSPATYTITGVLETNHVTLSQHSPIRVTSSKWSEMGIQVHGCIGDDTLSFQVQVDSYPLYSSYHWLCALVYSQWLYARESRKEWNEFTTNVLPLLRDWHLFEENVFQHILRGYVLVVCHYPPFP